MRQIRTPDKLPDLSKRTVSTLALLGALAATVLTIVFPIEQRALAAGPDLKQVEVIKQKHAYLGSLEMILAEDALRISENVNGTVVIARAPQWKVTVYNTRNKLYYDMSLDTWKKHGLRVTWVMMANTSDWPVVKAGSEKFLGRDTDVYLLPADPNARAKIRMHKPVDFNYGKAGEYWVDKKPGPRERTTVIMQLYKLPEVPQTPLALKAFNPGNSGFFGVSNTAAGKETMLLQTFSIKKAMMPASTFDVPSGYKRAKDDSEVTISKSNADSLDSIVEEMGLGRKFYNKQKSK